MFIPGRYKNENVEEILQFIQKNSFALLITTQNGMPLITHLPVELEVISGNTVLRGHVSRANNQHHTFTGKGVAVFQGPHSYISSSWYNHVNVPTWNYIAVHVTGQLRILNDDELYNSLKVLTDRYESAMENPVSVEGMHGHVIHQMKGIVGFEMTMDKMEGKWKLSQNRDAEDYQNIILQLEKINKVNELMIAEEMKKQIRTAEH